ncbi:hypothetical protein ABW21_db0201570 [Orbilia brochopaga]|nr:hypothetical protein ABW21_db0201570 [Drechslerella brochopaga]
MVTSKPIDGPSKPVLHPAPPTLDEDSIDDLLYFARTGELDDLKATIKELAKSLNRYAIEIAAAAVDSYSGNTCLHMAAANNHGAVISCILALEQPPLATPVARPELAAPVTLAAASTSASTDAVTTPARSAIVAAPGTPAAEGGSAYLHALVNWPNSSGNTPLHWACLNGHIETVKALVLAGADPGVLNAAGHDCVYEAEVNDKSNVVEWVLNYAESLESGVGVVADDEEKEDEGQGKESGGQDDNAKVLRDEGRHHEQDEDKEQEEEGSQLAIERLGLDDLGDRPPTIR